MGPRASTPSAETTSATLYIIRRHMKTGGTHKHVDRVQLSDGKTTLSRKKAIALMELGIVFKTRAGNGKVAIVSVVKCDRCKKQCLRTHPDMSQADDLDNLAPFTP
jgi:hypothetical protein